jgi:hypothetical protein
MHVMKCYAIPHGIIRVVEVRCVSQLHGVSSHLLQVVSPGLGATQSPTRCVPGPFPLGVKLTANLHMMPSTRVVEPYLHSSMHLEYAQEHSLHSLIYKTKLRIENLILVIAEFLRGSMGPHGTGLHFGPSGSRHQTPSPPHTVRVRYNCGPWT